MALPEFGAKGSTKLTEDNFKYYKIHAING